MYIHKVIFHVDRWHGCKQVFQFASKTLPAVSSVLAELHLYIYHLLYMCFRVMLA